MSASTSSSPSTKEAMPHGAYNLPHPAYAEDQPYSRSILSAHVLYRGFQSGALVGALIGLARRPRTPATTKFTSVLRAAGRGSVYGTAAMGVGLVGRMWGRTDIEWRDRAWRLLENHGQVSTDYWSGAGAGAGALLAMARANGRGALFVLGAAGLGSLLGVGDSIGYRMAMGTFN